MASHHLYSAKQEKADIGQTGAGVEIELIWNSESCVIALALPGVTLRRAVKYLST